MRATEEIKRNAHAVLASHRDFMFLGRGRDRTVYLGPDGLVYKVANDADGVDAQYHEMRTLAEGLEMPEGWRLADATLVEVSGVPVVVMEYVIGTEEKLDNHTLDVLAGYMKLYDLHPGQYRVTAEGERVVFDYSW